MMLNKVSQDQLVSSAIEQAKYYYKVLNIEVQVGKNTYVKVECERIKNYDKKTASDDIIMSPRIISKSHKYQPTHNAVYNGQLWTILSHETSAFLDILSK